MSDLADDLVWGHGFRLPASYCKGGLQIISGVISPINGLMNG